MMFKNMSPCFLLFGDQSESPLPAIRNLGQQSNYSTLLQLFLRNALDVVQAQASCLSADERRPTFDAETFLELAESYEKQNQPDDLIVTVLMYIAQVGELIM